MAFQLIRDPTTPITPIVDLAMAKAHCRVDFDDDDGVLQLYLDVAHAYIEGPQGVGGSLGFGVSKWTFVSGRPWDNVLKVPMRPVVSVEKVETLQSVAGVDTWVEWSTEQWRVSWNRDVASIVPNVNFFWPITLPRDDVVRVSFTAGWGDAAMVPAQLRAAILLHVGHMYEHREAVAHGQTMQETPFGYDALLASFRSGQA